MIWPVHPRHLKYCLINCFSAQHYLMCPTLVCSLSSGSTLPELNYWEQHLGSQWVICDANSSRWPISELWLRRTVNELKVGIRWFLEKATVADLSLRCVRTVYVVREVYTNIFIASCWSCSTKEWRIEDLKTETSPCNTRAVSRVVNKCIYSP